MNTLEQGDLGEASAIEWLTNAGAAVYLPVGHSPDADVVADMAGRLVRVQVKTSTYRRKERWITQICTRGGNQSWTGLTKRMSPDRCDFLFVLVGDGRRWFIPSPRLEATCAICLGGPKYAEFEVERGRPLHPPDEFEVPLYNRPSLPWGDTQAVNGAGL